MLDLGKMRSMLLLNQNFLYGDNMAKSCMHLLLFYWIYLKEDHVHFWEVSFFQGSRFTNMLLVIIKIKVEAKLFSRKFYIIL